MKLFIFLSVAVFFIAACIYGERRAREKVKQRFWAEGLLTWMFYAVVFAQKMNSIKTKSKK